MQLFNSLSMRAQMNVGIGVYNVDSKKLISLNDTNTRIIQ